MPAPSLIAAEAELVAVPGALTAPPAQGPRQRRGAQQIGATPAAPAPICVYGVPLRINPNASYLGQRQGANGQSMLLEIERPEQAVRATENAGGHLPPALMHYTDSSFLLPGMGPSSGPWSPTYAQWKVADVRFIRLIKRVILGGQESGILQNLVRHCPKPCLPYSWQM